MDNQCYYCEQIFESKEKLYEHLIVHSNPRMELKNKTIPKKPVKQRHRKRNKLVPVSNETNVKTKSKLSPETEKLLREIADLSDLVLHNLSEIQGKRKDMSDSKSS